MRKQKKSILALAVMTAFVATGFLLPKLIGAGKQEPGAPPGPTTKTLDEIPPTWSKTLPASERFVLVLNDQAVLDKETGLVWAIDANLAGEQKQWEQAIFFCRILEIGNRKGWRLPTVEELASLVDPTQMWQRSGMSLPINHPFSNVQFSYWSTTTYTPDSDYAWHVSMNFGFVGYSRKTGYFHVWPVRGGSGQF